MFIFWNFTSCYQGQNTRLIPKIQPMIRQNARAGYNTAHAKTITQTRKATTLDAVGSGYATS
jgi:hypothetical protein